MDDDDEVPQLTTLDDHLADAFDKLQRPNEEGDYTQEKISEKVPITILTGVIFPRERAEKEATLDRARQRC